MLGIDTLGILPTKGQTMEIEVEIEGVVLYRRLCKAPDCLMEFTTANKRKKYHSDRCQKRHFAQSRVALVNQLIDKYEESFKHSL